MSGEFAPGLDEMSPTGQPPSYSFDHGDWLKLCTSMCLTLLEAERLFECLAGPEKHTDDFRALLELLRTTVEPDVPLEHFVRKALEQYDSLDNAFNTLCEDLDSINGKERALRWPGFYSMAVALNVNNNCAVQLWNVLTKSNLTHGHACDLLSSSGDLDKGSGAISQEAFLCELSLWGPDIALGKLKGHLCKRFAILAEGQGAREDQLPLKADCSPRDLEPKLRSASGIQNCDVKATPKDGHLSPDTAIRTGRDGARSSVRSQMQPLWWRLGDVQTDVRRGCDWPASGERGAHTEVALASKSTLLKAADRHKFTEAIHGAVRSAASMRSRSVLHQAHHQVLKLEKRWANMSLPPQDYGVVGPSRRPSIAGVPSTLGSASTGNPRSNAGKRRSAATAGVPESKAA